MKHMFTIVFFILAGVAPVFPTQADLAQVNLTMTGVIVDSTCDIDVNSKNQNVFIGSFSTTDFTSVGSVSTEKPFSITFKKCTAKINNANITFTGTSSSDPTLLSLSDTSGSGNMATGVAIQILDENKRAIALNSQSPQQYPLKAGDNTLQFALRYKSTQAQVAPGNASAVLYFSVDYQ